MRWKFPIGLTLEETILRKEYLNRIEEWWKSFCEQEPSIVGSIKRQSDFNVGAWVSSALAELDPHLMFEFGPHPNGHRLSITSESRYALRPLVETIISHAPSLPHWTFVADRPRVDLGWMSSVVRGRTGSELPGFKVGVKLNAGGMIDLTYFSLDVSQENEQKLSYQAVVVAECLLGEEVLRTWIGSIVVEPIGRINWHFGKGMVGLSELSKRVDTLIGAVKDQMPDRPFWKWEPPMVSDPEPGKKWLGSLFRIYRPESASTHDDFSELKDLYLGMSTVPDLWLAATASDRFCNQRYSRFGEVFAYLKYDHGCDSSDEVIRRRNELGGSLDGFLRDEKLGQVFGSGLGVRYCYIFMAFLNPLTALGKIRSFLQSQKLPQRSWIQFFDVELALEWVAVWDDTPAPPQSQDATSA